MSEYTLLTSESVSEGHPDKLADRISDAILDAMLEHDRNSRVACETLVKSGLVVVAGEISTAAQVDDRDFEDIARNVILKTGYGDDKTGMDLANCKFVCALTEQSQDISRGVVAVDKDQGAGDQGMMFGYATEETEELMPAPIYYAHQLMRKHASVRRSAVDFLGPDAKCQLTFVYNDGKPVAIDTIVLSTQHSEDVSSKDIEEAVREEITRPTLPSNWVSGKTKYYINPTGKFVIGGPEGDCGLTGRKIIVDTYGGMAHHGGGAFSGKDPSKVDRSAAYAVRHVAKNIVAAGLASRCEIQVSYAIGRAEPTSVSVNSFGTNRIADEKIVDLIESHFDLRPACLIEDLNLKRPIYEQTATFGHFGRNEPDFTWERTDKVEALRSDAGV